MNLRLSTGRCCLPIYVFSFLNSGADMKKLIAIIPVTALLAACNPDNSGASREARQTMTLTEAAAVTIGMPAIKTFAEKRQLKAIYELRDNAALTTYTYTLDMNGKRHKVCPGPSIGFGIPYATQYTAPKALRMGKGIYPEGSGYTNNQEAGWSRYEAEQAEPNGLYMPQSADGTWVLCVHPQTKEPAPTYVEPRVIVYLFEMPAAD